MSAQDVGTARASFGVIRVEVSGFRSAREVAFSPGPPCALVGVAGAHAHDDDQGHA